MDAPGAHVASAEAILLDLHGRLLRLLSWRAGVEFEGLATAGRYFRLNNRLKKKLCRLDAASAFLRHASVPKAASFYSEISNAIFDLPSVRTSSVRSVSASPSKHSDADTALCSPSPGSSCSTVCPTPPYSSPSLEAKNRDLLRDSEVAYFNLYDDNEVITQETQKENYIVDSINNNGFIGYWEPLSASDTLASAFSPVPTPVASPAPVGIDEETADKILQQLANFRDAYAYIDMLCAENVAGSPDKLTTELLLNLDCDDESDQIIDQHRESMGINGALDNLCDYFVDSGVLT